MSNVFDLIKEIRDEAEGFTDEGLEKISQVEFTIEELQQKIYELTNMADEAFDSWYRLTFGSQARIEPDIKTAYYDGYRAGFERRSRLDKKVTNG